jgi:solute carrier family 25 citrate transporter 1
LRRQQHTHPNRHPLSQINCGSIAPITASQFGTNRFMERLLLQRSGGEPLSTASRFGCAAVAGTVSALVASPTELIIIQQQVIYR